VWSIVITHLYVHLSVFVSVHLSVCGHVYGTAVCRSPVAMAQSASSSIAIMYCRFYGWRHVWPYELAWSRHREV